MRDPDLTRGATRVLGKRPPSLAEAGTDALALGFQVCSRRGRQSSELQIQDGLSMPFLDIEQLLHRPQGVLGCSGLEDDLKHLRPPLDRGPHGIEQREPLALGLSQICIQRTLLSRISLDGQGERCQGPPWGAATP
jgi:hypothetical protein